MMKLIHYTVFDAAHKKEQREISDWSWSLTCCIYVRGERSLDTTVTKKLGRSRELMLITCAAFPYGGLSLGMRTQKLNVDYAQIVQIN